MIAIIDYGVGNLFSLSSSLSYVGLDNVVTRNAGDLRIADRIILPGVGAFGDAISKFRATGLEEPLLREVEAGKPLLGICLGMQLLFERGFEYGEYRGLGLIGGEIHTMEDDIKALGLELKVPQIGWNRLEFVTPEDPILQCNKDGDYVYYVHSYYAKGCDDALVATTPYGVQVPGIVRKENVYGMQFHPEKSGQVGMNLLRAFGQVQG